MSLRSFRKTGLAVFAVAAVGLAVGEPALAADVGEVETPAVWTPKEANFTYMGFTTKYSCEGLVSKVKSVLLSLGARKDLTVYGTGCLEAGRPAPMPGVKVRMNVLVPAGTSEAARDPSTVAAHWRPIRVQLNQDPLREAGECELVEQIKQKLLPLFSIRNVEFKPNCVPHQLHPGGTRLLAEVLLADQSERQAAATQPR